MKLIMREWTGTTVVPTGCYLYCTDMASAMRLAQRKRRCKTNTITLELGDFIQPEKQGIVVASLKKSKWTSYTDEV